MTKKQEGVYCIYKENRLEAIIKRDDATKKHLIYLTKEATSDDIAEMLAENGFQVDITTKHHNSMDENDLLKEWKEKE